MAERFDQIIEENSNLKKALHQAKSVIERTSDDYQTLRQIHEEYKMQGERSKRENDELHLKVISLTNDKKELEMQFDATIRNLKVAIDLKQREIEEVQAKIIPSFDQDMLRIKIINELEIPHRNMMEAKQEEFERMQELIYDHKRQIDILNSKLEIANKERDRDIKSIKDRHQVEIVEMMNELQSANEKIDDQRDKDTIRKMRREIEELKQKYAQKDQESEDLRRERDKCREEKNDCLIKFSKQIDGERNDKRIYKTESEKLAIRVRFLDEDSKKNKIKLDSIINDNEIQKREKDTFLEEIRKKDDLIHQLQRRISELEDEHVAQEGKALEKEQKIYNEEREKFLEERNRVISLQREFDQLKQNYSEVSEENKQLRTKIQKELSALRTDNLQITEERDKLKRIQQSLEKENQDHEKQAKQREEQLNELERELENVRKRYRETQQRIQNLENSIDSLQRNKPINQVQPNVVGSEDNSQIKKSLEIEKKKSNKLKEKLKQANEKIMDLLQFKVKAQAQQKQGGGGSFQNGLAEKYPINDISNINAQPQQNLSPQLPHLQQQFNYSYQNSSINPGQSHFPVLSYEDERIIQEINRATDNHKYSYV